MKKCTIGIFPGLVRLEYDEENVIFHDSKKKYYFRWNELPGDRIQILPSGKGYMFHIFRNGPVRKIPVMPWSFGFQDLKKMLESKGVLQRISQNFYPVSKRARGAYLILCLEEALKFYGQDLEKWRWVLEKLWEITMTTDEEGWIFQTSNLLPEQVLPYLTYEAMVAARKEQPIYFAYSFSKEQFLSLQTLYRESFCSPADALIEELLGNIYLVITEDWGDLETPHTPSALKYIEQTKVLLKEHGIPLPCNAQTLDFLMDQKHPHMGRPFPGLSFSALP